MESDGMKLARSGDGPERPFRIDDWYRTAACFLSHYFLLRRLRDASEEELVMVVEDDVVFAPDFSARAKSGALAPGALELPSDWDVLKTCLQGQVRPEDAISTSLYRVALPTVGGSWTGKYLYTGQCGYIVKPASLGKVVAHLRTVSETTGITDVDMAMLAGGALQTYALVRPAASHDYEVRQDSNCAAIFNFSISLISQLDHQTEAK